MERQEKASRRVGLLVTALLCFVSWACIFLVLSALANATEYTPPAEPAEPELPLIHTEAYYTEHLCGNQEYPGPEGESWWWTQQNTSETCANLRSYLPALAERQFWLVAEMVKEREKVEQLHGDLAELHADLGTGGSLFAELKLIYEQLQTKGGLPVSLASLPELPAGSKTLGTVTISNPTSVAGVESAVSQGTETGNQNLWAIFGMVVGFGLLMVLWRLIRP